MFEFIECIRAALDNMYQVSSFFFHFFQISAKTVKTEATCYAIKKTDAYAK